MKTVNLYKTYTVKYGIINLIHYSNDEFDKLYRNNIKSINYLREHYIFIINIPRIKPQQPIDTK